MEGEAFFEVNPGDIPFIVESNTAEVTVLGTRFNVNTWYDATQVTVQEGRVRLSVSDQPDVNVELGASEAAVLNADNELTTLNVEQVGGAFDWMEGILSFNQAPLWQVVQEMERTFDQEIRINPDKTDQIIGGSIRTDSLSQALETVCLIAACSVSSSDGIIILE